MSVMDEVREEREYQDQRWGPGVDDVINTPWMWAVYVVQYVTQDLIGPVIPIKKAEVDRFRRNLIKAAALCIAAVESLDRQRYQVGHAFYEEV